MGIWDLLAVAGIVVGIPLGVYYLVKKEKPAVPVGYSNWEGKARMPLQSNNQDWVSPGTIIPAPPVEISGWNWGAAGLTWIWGLAHGVWISLLVFIPYVGLFFWIILGIKGNEWAWKAKKWESVEAFKRSQERWRPWGIFFFILPWLITIAFFILLINSPAPPSSVRLQNDTYTKSEAVVYQPEK